MVRKLYRFVYPKLGASHSRSFIRLLHRIGHIWHTMPLYFHRQTLPDSLVGRRGVIYSYRTPLNRHHHHRHRPPPMKLTEICRVKLTHAKPNLRSAHNMDHIATYFIIVKYYSVQIWPPWWSVVLANCLVPITPSTSSYHLHWHYSQHHTTVHITGHMLALQPCTFPMLGFRLTLSIPIW